MPHAPATRAGERLRHVHEHIARTAAKPLTERQTHVLAYIRERLAAGTTFPGERDIQHRFGWKYSEAAKDVLLALAARGLLAQAGWQQQGRCRRAQWQLTEKGRTAEVSHVATA